MPYWSSSKVGADPQGQPTMKQQQQRKRFSKSQKGITMEDLKKQTALRLAQEQKKSGKKASVALVPQNGTADPSVPARLLPIGQNLNGNVNPQIATKIPSFPGSGPPLVTEQTSTGYQQHTYHPGLGNYSTPTLPNHNFRNEPEHQVRNEFDVLVPPTLSTSTSSFDSSQFHSNSSNQKSKLPHGLTVQELKEMTKARLQAEASEKPGENIPVRAMKGDPYNSVSTSLHFSRDYRDQHFPRPRSQTSPLPPGFTGYRSSENIGMYVEKREAWDTASVGTSASDYATSESVFSGVNGFDDNLGSVPFSRSGSYPTSGSIQDYEWQAAANDSNVAPPPSYVLAAPSPYYDVGGGFAPNRRRAATLSPRPVGLSNLHEDRPLLLGNHLPLIQQTSSSQSMFHSRQEWNGQDRVPGSMQYKNIPYDTNRSLVSSAVSLPQVPLSSEDVSGEGGGRSIGSVQRFTNGFAIVREDAPTPPVTDLSSVFRISPNGHQHGRFEDRFRDPALSSIGLGSSRSFIGTAPGHTPVRKRAETDFLQTSDQGFRTNHGFARAPGSVDSRLRAATWGEPSIDMLGLRMFSFDGIESTANDRLADDLASILQLAGSEKSDHVFAPPGF